ncbi:MAG: DNA topoisomerase IV subunit A [Kofleriaceae bacterium]|nr:DNA topoisomerase IV subunit A [Myxococcales bacterium]MCB9560892.1 DNA topoisomerase IV subunit A [Kofleriaceae bacterium]
MAKKQQKATIAPRESRKGKGGGGKPPGGDIFDHDGGGGGEQDASLQVEARRRYLNYALSVITARALPDVRDGLKPVQRRILYAMLNDEHLRPDAKYRKSAKVVGTVIGRYHPHGDTAVYDTMVRMAQDFVLRLPLVDGSGNFGSLDGDAPAAYRYTECRLAPPAMELLRELDADTVDMRANYDGTTEEPVVLPARFPNLLVNGSTGIAVGMATNIPPHNLREVVAALVALAEDRDLGIVQLMKHVQGPDFPTGGQMLNSKVELRQIYETGQGAIKVRGEYKVEDKKRGGQDLIITSIPWGLTKADVVEKIADVIISRKLPFLLDVRDESTTDVRIVLELKRDADPAMVMSYLYKHTPLQVNFHMNITCLVPPEYLAGGGQLVAGGVPQPQRLGLKDVLGHFLDFRYEVTCRRFEHALAELKKRIHILEGFAIIFDALDECIKIIRASDGKQDAAGKLMKRFKLDEIQVEAILELKLYKLAKLEIRIIREELEDKLKEARRIEAILKSETRLWGVIKDELEAVAEQLGTPRKTKTGGGGDEVEFDADAFIVDEDANVVVTRDGWIKRVRELKDPTATRLREGDEVMAVLAGSTRERVVFFTNYGTAYVMKINDVSATAGYGDPAQKYFKFKDGERIVSAMSLDARVSVPETLLAVSANGYGLRFAITPYRDETTKAGRRYARPADGDEIVGVVGCGDADVVVAATRGGHVLVCKADEINKLEGPGRGVTVIKTDADDQVIGFLASADKKERLVVETEGGKRFELAADPHKTVARGGKGNQIIKRSALHLVRPPVVVTPLAAAGEGGN